MRGVAALAVAFAATFTVARGQTVPIDELMRRVGRYVAEYERAFSVVVARERYVQRAFSGSDMQLRDLRSEIALVALEGRDWVMFRDVYQIDGHEVHDRHDRLSALFLAAKADAGAQARRIYEESTRYNIGAVERTINSPAQVLEFFRAGNQSRSTFRLGGRSTVAGQTAWEVRFQETGRPRFIRTTDEAAASGRAWLLPDSGAILRTELRLDTAGGSVSITVHYGRDERVGLWVPTRMIESYVRSPATGGSVTSGDANSVRIEGDATYSDFRRFSVDTRTIIK